MHGLLALAGQVFEDRPAGGVGEGFENMVGHGLHGTFITMWLWIVNCGRASNMSPE